MPIVKSIIEEIDTEIKIEQIFKSQDLFKPHIYRYHLVITTKEGRGAYSISEILYKDLKKVIK